MINSFKVRELMLNGHVILNAVVVVVVEVSQTHSNFKQQFTAFIIGFVSFG
jgi:NADH:ubiquinone oxidoreductase subunit K